MNRTCELQIKSASLGLLLAAALAGPLCRAQSAPLTTGITTLPGGRVQLAITNNSAVPVTAFAVYIEWTLPGGGPKAHSVRIVDSVINYPRDREIMPGDTQRFVFGGVMRMSDRAVSPPRITFEAAVFADGSTFGDPGWAQRIVQDRENVYENAGRAIQELLSARDSIETRKELISRFDALRDQVLHSALYQGIVGRYQGIIATLPFDNVLTNLQHAVVAGRGLAPMDTLTPILIAQLRKTRQRLYASKPSVTSP